MELVFRCESIVWIKYCFVLYATYLVGLVMHFIRPSDLVFIADRFVKKEKIISVSKARDYRVRLIFIKTQREIVHDRSNLHVEVEEAGSTGHDRKYTMEWNITPPFIPVDGVSFPLLQPILAVSGLCTNLHIIKAISPDGRRRQNPNPATTVA